jgi:hypothetical protein
MSQPPKPLPRVSAKHYGNQAAKVRFRVKGNADGPIYQGQVQIVPCAGCSGAKRKIDFRPASGKPTP